MQKLDKEQIKKLTHGSKHHVRLTRLSDYASFTIFEGEAELHIQKFSKTMIITTTIIEPSGKDLCWAEASEGDIEPDGSIIVEDYLMEIFS